VNFGAQASVAAPNRFLIMVAFFCARAVLMVADNGRVNHGVFVVGVLRERFKNALSDSGFVPAGKAGMYHAEIPKAFRNITPRNASGGVQNGFHEQAVVTGIGAHVAGASG
jgi:hypothetical protein